MSEKMSIIKVATRFSVSKSLVQKQARATTNRGKLTAETERKTAI
jgi:transposase